MKGGGGGWTEERTFINKHVLILNTWVNKGIIIVIIIIIIIVIIIIIKIKV